MVHYVGLDVSSKETAYCVQDDRGTIVVEGMVETCPEAISAVLRGCTPELIGIETSSLSHWLVTELQNRNLPAILIDAKTMAALLSTQINKNDQNDARAIARALRTGGYRKVEARTPESQSASALLSARDLLVRQRVQIKNTLRGLLKIHGIVIRTCGTLSFEESIRSRIKPLDPVFSEAIHSLLEQFSVLTASIKKLTRHAENLAAKDEDTKLLMTVPGIGPLTALAYKIAIGDPKRFASSQDVGAYLGLTPRQYASGETDYKGRISKHGPKKVRNLLVEAAVVMLTRTKSWFSLKTWGMQLAKRKGLRKAAVACARKLAVLLHHIWLSREPFRWAKPDSCEAKEVLHSA